MLGPEYDGVFPRDKILSTAGHAIAIGTRDGRKQSCIPLSLDSVLGSDDHDIIHRTSTNVTYRAKPPS